MIRNYIRRRRSVGSSIDADAESYFSTASITDETEKSAVRTLITSLKSNSLWTKMERLYLMSPTSSAACLTCAKSLDQSATAVDTPTFSALGVEFNGTSEYIDTNFAANAGSIFVTNSNHISYYVTKAQEAIGGSLKLLLGADNGTTCQIRIFHNNTTEFLSAREQNSNAATMQLTNGGNLDKALFCATRRGANETEFYKNGASIATGVAASVALPTQDFYIGCSNVSGTPTGFNATGCGFVSIGAGLTDMDATNLYNAVLAYQTALGRN